jgi:hypothetical protein
MAASSFVGGMLIKTSHAPKSMVLVKSRLRVGDPDPSAFASGLGENEEQDESNFVDELHAIQTPSC